MGTTLAPPRCDRRIAGKICDGTLQRLRLPTAHVVAYRCRACGQGYEELHSANVLCAICTDEVRENETSMVPCGLGDVMVRVCRACRDEWLLAGRAP